MDAVDRADAESGVRMKQPDPRNFEAVELLGKPLEEKPIWADLYENIRDVFFSPKLPPLELTSTPIPTADRMAVRTNPWAVGTSALVNGGLVAMLLCVGLGTMSHFTPPHSGPHVDLGDLNLLTPLRGPNSGGGGGGGANDPIEATKGAPPKMEMTPLAPPQIPLLEHPQLPVDPAVAAQIKLPENTAMPNLGLPDSVNVRLPSNGPGTEGGLGLGKHGGDGPGEGPGLGPGEDGGTGGQIYQPGIGGVTAPIPIVQPEAEFSDEARREKYQGVCLISVLVDAQGNPRNPRVVRRLGMGLDEKAVEAVLRYRFRPATRAGKPVPVLITVVVNFRLY